MSEIVSIEAKVLIHDYLFESEMKAGPTPLIQNGEKAEKNEYSVIVLALARVTDQRATFGGGSVISKRHILTAAHLCVK